MTPTSGWPQRTDELARLLGVDTVTLVRVHGGSSRDSYRIETPSGQGLAFLRADVTAGGSMGGSELTLAREATLMRRVRALGFPVPEVLGSFENPSATVLELVAGTSRPDAAAVEKVAPEYMALLGRLHEVDPAALDLPSAASLTEAVRTDLAWWANRAAHTGVDARPLVRLALRVLAATAPVDPSPPKVVHGDAGPGNFMVADGRVSGLLDWELCHAGDPHEDLAWIWMRGGHTDFGQFTDRLAEYERATGRQIDLARLDWYAALVMTKSAIGLWTAAGSAGEDVDVLNLLIAALAYDALLGSALVRIYGGSLPLLTEAPSATAPPETLLVDELAAALGQPDRRTAAIVEHLRRHLALSDWQCERLAEDIRAHLGGTLGDGAPAALAELVDTAPPTALPTLALVIGAAADRASRVQPRAERIVRRAQALGLGR